MAETAAWLTAEEEASGCGALPEQHGRVKPGCGSDQHRPSPSTQ